MKKSRATRLVVQSLAVLIGLYGLGSIYGGVHFAVTGIRDSDSFQMLFLAPLLLAIGCLLVVFTWQALWRFGPSVIKGVVGLIVFFLWSRVTARLFPPPIETEDDSWLFHYEEGMILLSLLLAYILYRTVSGRLIKLAETGSVQQADTDVPKAAD